MLSNPCPPTFSDFRFTGAAQASTDATAPRSQDSKVYPVLVDAAGTVLSLPPVINGAATAVSLATRDIFIECTATDLAKAKVVLNTVVTMFSECARATLCAVQRARLCPAVHCRNVPRAVAVSC